MEKRNNARTAIADEICAWAHDGGFFSRFQGDAPADRGQLAILIRSGFMLLQAFEDAEILQWSVSADETDTTRAKDVLRHLLVPLGELRQPEFSYRRLADHLGVNIGTVFSHASGCQR